MWNRVLTPSEIASVYASNRFGGHLVAATNLVFAHPFDFNVTANGGSVPYTNAYAPWHVSGTNLIVGSNTILGSTVRYSEIVIDSAPTNPVTAFEATRMNHGWSAWFSEELRTNGPFSDAVLAWELESPFGGIAQDSSTTGVEGVISAPSFTQSRGRFARQFDGVDDYIRSGFPTAMPTGSTARTFAFWFQQNVSPTQYGCLLSYSNAAGTADLAIKVYDDGSINFTGGAGGVPIKNTDIGVINTGVWYHLIVSITNTAGWPLTGFFMTNGVEALAGGVLGAIDTPPSSLWVGKDAGVTGRYWKGWIDDIMIFPRGLTMDEAADLYERVKP